MKNFLSLILFGLISALSIQAQSPADIFRYSQRSYSGTARSMALAGAQTSLGADFGSLTYNPAGIALYRSSELTISPGFNGVNSDSRYLNNTHFDSANGLSFGGAGLVLTSFPRKRKREKGWKFTNFGVGVNRIYNYNREYTSGAFNDSSSITEFFAENAQGFTENQLFDNGLYEYGALAYRAYLIDPTDTEGVYTSVLSNGQVDQMERVSSSGKKNEILIDYGVNFKDKYYFGAALGIVTMDSNREVFFSERDDLGNHSNFDFLDLTEIVNTTGSGVNFSVGTIIRLSDMIRFGAAFKTPTRMSVTETFNTDLRVRAIGANGLETFDESSPDGFFEYEYSEPYRFNTGLSFFIKQRGFVSVDYEFVDYGTMKVHYESGFQNTENTLNQGIRSRYQGVHNIKIGVEANLRSGLYARGGYSTASSPFVATELKSTTSRFGAGFGYRNDKYFVDLSYSESQQNFVRSPYELSNKNVPTADIDVTEVNIMLTIGKRF